MRVQQLEDLVAFQLSVEFKEAVYALVRSSGKASNDFRYKDQVYSAAASAEMNIAEGWGRFNPAEMMNFLRYARGSIHEARRHVLDGVSRGYFSLADCQKALTLANRSAGTITNLWKSIEPSVRSTTRNPPRRGRIP